MLVPHLPETSSSTDGGLHETHDKGSFEMVGAASLYGEASYRDPRYYNAQPYHYYDSHSSCEAPRSLASMSRYNETADRDIVNNSLFLDRMHDSLYGKLEKLCRGSVGHRFLKDNRDDLRKAVLLERIRLKTEREINLYLDEVSVDTSCPTYGSQAHSAYYYWPEEQKHPRESVTVTVVPEDDKRALASTHPDSIFYVDPIYEALLDSVDVESSSSSPESSEESDDGA